MGQVISEKISTTVMTTAHLTKRVRKAKKKVQMVVTYHTLVSQGMSNLCISVLFIPVVYIAMCYHISNNTKCRSLDQVKLVNFRTRT